MVITPFDPESLGEHLAQVGIRTPRTAGRAPDREVLEEILTSAGWPFSATERAGVWLVTFEEVDGRWPPISELTLHDSQFLGFRLGPLYGPFHVGREVARRCGPQVAVEGSGGHTSLITEHTS